MQLLHAKMLIHIFGVVQAPSWIATSNKYHPPYNPDMALSDNYLFEYLKKNFELQETDLAHFVDKPKDYF